MEFVPIPTGAFVMGSLDEDELAFEDEKPQHCFEIAYDYWTARFPVNNRQFAEFVRSTGFQTRAEREGRGWSGKARMGRGRNRLARAGGIRSAPAAAWLDWKIIQSCRSVGMMPWLFVNGSPGKLDAACRRVIVSACRARPGPAPLVAQQPGLPVVCNRQDTVGATRHVPTGALSGIVSLPEDVTTVLVGSPRQEDAMIDPCGVTPTCAIGMKYEPFR